MEPFVSFLAVAVAALLVPGPDTFVVMRVALTSGVTSGTWAAAGSGAGNLLWGTASVLGATGLVAASPEAFTALKLLGAGYLAFLGAQALAAAVRGTCFHTGEAASSVLGARTAFRRGLASDLMNVKVGLFWTALIPQFLTDDASALLPVAMVAVMGSLAFATLSACAWMSNRMSAALTGPRLSRSLNVAIGVTFVLLGAHLGMSA